MRAAKIDARDLASRIHRFQQAALDAGGIRVEREERQTLAAGSLWDARGDDQQVRHVAIDDVTFDSVETIAVRIGSGDKLDARGSQLPFGSVTASVASRAPLARSGSKADFCASVPAFRIALAASTAVEK